MLYSSPGELLDAVVPFVRAGLDAGEPVHLNLPPVHTGAVRDALGPDAGRVSWTDTYRWEPHPSRRQRAIEDLVDERLREGAAGLRYVGECAWPTGPDHLVSEWNRLDAVLNHSLAGRPVDMLCLYDSVSLAEAVIEEALCAHPHVGVGKASRVNDGYVPPEELVARLRPGELAPPAGAAREVVANTRAARSFLRRVLADRSLRPEQCDDAALVITELTANALNAGAGEVQAACWPEAHGLVVQVDDDGPGLSDPLAGYRRPDPESTSGRGLWMARQLADVVRFTSGPGGTSIRFEMLLAPVPTA